ncbi:MAG: hypothetical protein DRI84_07655 [Bacteroidetes bacterium]|nr:MAG: hypothetical protein DRI84_07655 [Bacteroidota bacterium]
MAYNNQTGYCSIGEITDLQAIRIFNHYYHILLDVSEAHGTHSKTERSRFFSNEKNLGHRYKDSFFQGKITTYRVDNYSKIWLISDKGLKVLEQSVMCPIEIKGEKMNLENVELEKYYNHFENLERMNFPGYQNWELKIDVKKLKNSIDNKDYTRILTLSKYNADGFNVVDTSNFGKTPACFGREYNLLCDISKTSRKALTSNFTGYDICSALHNITLQIIGIDEAKKSYPEIHRYATDDKHRKYLKRYLSLVYKMPEKDAKTFFISCCNGLTLKQAGKWLNKPITGVVATAMIHESKRLRKDLVEHTKHSNNMLYELAKILSTDQELDSIFFFIWTYHERQIRLAMLDYVDFKGYHLHDAIWVDDNSLNVLKMEEYVKLKTGFDIKIEKE